MAWRLADRTLDLEAPGTVVGAGIVNVTVDSMYEGARSGTAEQAITDGIALAEAGSRWSTSAPSPPAPDLRSPPPTRSSG